MINNWVEGIDYPIWMTEESLKTLNRQHLSEGESPKAMYNRIVNTLCDRFELMLKDKMPLHDRQNFIANIHEKWLEYLWNGWLCPSTPILSNCGTKRGLTISCFINRVPDSLTGIYQTLHETAMLTKYGGGVGITFDKVRGRGEVISGGGFSEGTIPFIKVYDSAIVATSQGCYDDQTELLTEVGWIKFSDLKTENINKVAQIDVNGLLSFTEYTDYIEYKPTEKLIHFTNKVNSIDLLVTPDHNMAIENRRRISNKRINGKHANNTKKLDGFLISKSAKTTKFHRDNYIWCAAKSVSLIDNELSWLERFMIAYQADGATNHTKNYTGEICGHIGYAFHLKKQRKIDRLTVILENLGWEYSLKQTKDDSTRFLVKIPVEYSVYKNFNDFFKITEFSQLKSRQFIDELSYWDGHRINNVSNAITYSCILKSNVDFVQSVCVLAGKTSKMFTRIREFPRQTLYSIYIRDADKIGGDTVTSKEVTYDGNVYCVTVPTNLLIVRRNGNVAVCGNSSRRGAISINLPIRHKDIREFLKIRLPIGDVNRQSLNVNHCVTIDDFFYEDLLNGEQSSREIWSELLSSRMKTGQPYIFNYHTVNNNRPEDWKKRNMKIDGTNLCCLAGDTKVFTREGIFKIKDLVGWEVTVFDGENWVKCNNFKSYGFDDIYKLTLENGSQIECNSGHRHVLDDGSIKTTFELSFGDRIKIKTLKLNEFVDDWSQYCTFEPLHDKQEVFCPTIPTTGKFLLANGVLTGNSEIMGVHDFDNTVVCDLASLNLSKWDEWKDDPEFIENCLLFLDVNLEEFIEKAKDINGFEKAVNFASRSRMLGLGVLGWHTLLQSKNLPFNSIPSQGLIRKIAGKMKNDGNVYNKKWGKILGNPEWCDENRNIALFAIAPTTTNSLVSGGVSQGIEPLICNAWIQKSAKGTFIRKNKFFETLMETKYPDKNTEQFWNALMSEYKGSVQDLDFLTESEKEVLLTAYEINQLELVKCAAIWQQYIDQGISLNLFFPADVDPKWLNKVHLTAWEEGVKTLYYVRTESILSRNMKGSTFSDCLYCEG